MTRMRPALVDWGIACDFEPAASGREPLSPYLEAPSIAEGMTVDEYRRARAHQAKPRLERMLGLLRHLRRAGQRPESAARAGA
jgi:hypothetical protein